MDLEKIRALLELLNEHDVNDFRYEDAEMNLRLRVLALAWPDGEYAVYEGKCAGSLT